MRTDRKARVQQLAQDLQRDNSPGALATKEILHLLLEDAKHSLITTTGEATLLKQGEAQAIDRILTMLTRVPVSITAKGGNQ